MLGRGVGWQGCGGALDGSGQEPNLTCRRGWAVELWGGNVWSWAVKGLVGKGSGKRDVGVPGDNGG